jgi:NIPSNAP protein
MKKQLTVGSFLVFAGFALGRISAGSALVLAAPAPAAPYEQNGGTHVYELRTYTAAEGRLPNLQARFRDHTVTIFARHGIKSVGYWTPIEGPTAGTTLVYLLEHPSRDDARKNWADFAADPEWKKVKADSETNAGGPLTTKIDSLFLAPTDYSPMK